MKREKIENKNSTISIQLIILITLLNKLVLFQPYKATEIIIIRI